MRREQGQRGQRKGRQAHLDEDGATWDEETVLLSGQDHGFRNSAQGGKGGAKSQPPAAGVEGSLLLTGPWSSPRPRGSQPLRLFTDPVVSTLICGAKGDRAGETRVVEAATGTD